MSFDFHELEKFEARIQSYLSGSMEEAQVLQFEKLMRINNDLTTEVAFRQKLKFVHENEELISFNDALSEIINDTPLVLEEENNGKGVKEEVVRKSKFSPVVKFALWLSFMVVVSLISWLLYQGVLGTSVNATAIGNKHLAPFENIINIDNQRIDPFKLGMEAYDQKQYAESIEQLSLHLDFFADNNAKFYLALSYLLNDEAPEAINYFQELTTLNDTIYDAPVQWYLALSYLKVNQTEEAEKILKGLLTNNLYKNKAQKVLDELKIE